MATEKKMEFRVLSANERVSIVRDFLRGAEAEYFRLNMLPANDSTRADRLAGAKAEVTRLQAEFDSAFSDEDAAVAP